MLKKTLLRKYHVNNTSAVQSQTAVRDNTDRATSIIILAATTQVWFLTTTPYYTWENIYSGVRTSTCFLHMIGYGFVANSSHTEATKWSVIPVGAFACSVSYRSDTARKLALVSTDGLNFKTNCLGGLGGAYKYWYFTRTAKCYY